MAAKTAIITDSGASLTEEVIGEGGIYVIPMSVVDGDGEPLASGTDVSSSEMEERLRDGEEFTTTAVSPADMVSAVNQAVQDGYDQAVVVTTSSGLSSTYDMACLLAGDLAETDKIQLDVVDSRSIGAATGLVAMEAKALVDGGFEFGSIASRMSGAVAQTRVWFATKTLDWLRRGGRIDAVTYRLGTLMNAKPILTCSDDGTFSVRKKARGWKRVAPSLVSFAEEMAQQFHNVRIAVCATDSLKDEARQMADEVRKWLQENGIVVDAVLEAQFPPELLVHTGPDAMGLAVQGTTL